MNAEKKKLAQKIYLVLASLFITSLVVSNLIFQKFFYWYPVNFEIFGEKLFNLSVGILPYPITFLITDLISEIYGKKKANQVVTVGIFAAIFSTFIIFVADAVPAIENSPIDDMLFKKVFGSTIIAVFSSMLSYLFAQYIDIHIYHFWKNLTKGKIVGEVYIKGKSLEFGAYKNQKKNISSNGLLHSNPKTLTDSSRYIA